VLTPRVRSEEYRRRRLEAGWKARLHGAGLIVWHRPERWGSWYTLDVAPQILEAMKEGGGGSNRDA